MAQEKAEKELWLEYRKTNDPKLRETFIKKYACLVKTVAATIPAGMRHDFEFDDLVGFGVFVLLDAIDKYDPDKNVKFKTYAVTKIRRAIFNEIHRVRHNLPFVPICIEQEEIRKVIIEAINELPEKEKKILYLYYHENLSLEEIGRVLEIWEGKGD
jgi:RNA polymerase sigma factor for flagellar operon FliA